VTILIPHITAVPNARGTTGAFDMGMNRDAVLQATAACAGAAMVAAAIQPTNAAKEVDHGHESFSIALFGDMPYNDLA